MLSTIGFSRPRSPLRKPQATARSRPPARLPKPPSTLSMSSVATTRPAALIPAPIRPGDRTTRPVWWDERKPGRAIRSLVFLVHPGPSVLVTIVLVAIAGLADHRVDRKSTRLNSSHA